ncbi:hypothetical protein BQ8482_110584 [Mesorhizobium delmotii]|uniref:Uncharacterized protein n=1 Tax=Mesorhizobium delmotii TaxID=1631247 RepID=A0A2P9AC16_9HYPH|nr:hypothetical protein BQ8482_110584 [Mesorhizobium delmotii]
MDATNASCYFRSGAERTAKTVPRGGDAEPLINAAAMVFDGADSDAQPCAGMLGFLPHGLSWPFTAVPGRLMAVFASFG